MNNDRVTHVNDTLRRTTPDGRSGDRGGVRISRAAETLGGRYTILVAAQVAANLLVVVYLYLQHNTSATVALVVTLVATCRW